MSNTCVEFGHDITGTTANIYTNGEPGQRYYDQTTGTWKVYNGTDWQAAQDAGAGGAAGCNRTLTKTLTAMTDNTATSLATITIPNVKAGGMVRVRAVGVLGDGDSSEAVEILIAVSRIAGANAKATAGAAFGTAQITGASGNAAVTISLGSVGGGVTATNTFAINAKIARSAGSADNHTLVAEIQVLNSLAGGITVA